MKYQASSFTVLSLFLWITWFSSVSCLFSKGMSSGKLKKTFANVIWKNTKNGKIPDDAVFSNLAREKSYFCLAEDSKTGKTYVGTILPGNDFCEFLVLQDPVILGGQVDKQMKKNSSYKVLSKKYSTEANKSKPLSWIEHQLGTTIVPEGAIPCGSSGEGEDCYLAASVYSDGLCKEAIGKTHTKYSIRSHKSHFHAHVISHYRNVASGDVTADGSICPFFVFLVTN